MMELAQKVRVTATDNLCREMHGLGEAPMTSDAPSNLVLVFGRVLYVNGQTTEQTVGAAERLGRALGLRAKIVARWGELQLVAGDKDGTLISQAAADPVGVNMDRVVSTMRAIEDIEAGRLAPGAAMKQIGAISQAAPAQTTPSSSVRITAGLPHLQFLENRTSKKTREAPGPQHRSPPTSTRTAPRSLARYGS